MLIAITGHRPKYLGNEYNLIGPYSDYIRVELQKIIDKYKPIKMISGMAIGVDTIWAELAIKNKIPLIAAVPFVGQESRWPKTNKIKYCRLLEKAYETHIISDIPDNEMVPYSTAFHKRDKWMVNHANLVVAVLAPKNKSSGTAYTARYAENQKVPVIYINPNGWRL